MNEHNYETFCPLIEKAYEECYCNILRSRDIYLTIRYCCGAFEGCKIYNIKMKEIENAEDCSNE